MDVNSDESTLLPMPIVYIDIPAAFALEASFLAFCSQEKRCCQYCSTDNVVCVCVRV